MNLSKFFMFVLTTSLILTSCQKTSNLSDVIPADASYIIHINNKALIEKSEYDFFANQTIQQGINVAKAMLRDEAKVKFMDEFLKNSNSLGINLKEDFYIYSNYKTLGFVFGVNDAEKIRNILVQFSLISEQDIKKNGKQYSVSQGNRASLVWDDQKLIFLTAVDMLYSDSNDDDINLLALNSLNQKVEQSINNDKDFIEFEKNKKDISFFYSIANTDNLADLTILSNLPLGMSKMLGEMEGVSVGMYTSFENGAVKTNTKYYFQTPEVESKFKESVAKVSGQIKGEQLKHVPADPLFLVSGNVKGGGLLDLFVRMGIFDQLVENFHSEFDATEMEHFIKNYNGDITFALTSIKKSISEISMQDDITGEYFDDKISDNIPEYLFLVDIEDPSYMLSFIKEQLDSKSISYESLSSTAYKITQRGVVTYCGVDDNKTFYMTDIEAVYNSLNSDNLENQYSEVVNEKMILISGNIQSTKSLIEDNKDLAHLITLIEQLGKYQMTISANDFTGEGSLEFKTKTKNSLAIICEHIDQLISNLGSSYLF